MLSKHDMAAATDTPAAESGFGSALERCAGALAQCSVLLWSADDTLRLTAVHGRPASKLAIDLDAVDGLYACSLFEDGETALAHHRIALGGRPSSFPCIVAGRPFEAQVTPIRDVEGDVIGVTGAAMDMTDRDARHQNELTRQRMDALGQIVGAMAHDFNNVLTIIGSYSQFLMERFEPTAAAYEDASIVHGAARRAGDLIQKLLVFGRRQHIHLERVDLSELVSSATATLAERSQPHQLQVVCTQVSLPVQVDELQLVRALGELVENATEATSEPGTLKVSTRRAQVNDGAQAAALGIAIGDWAIVSVTDEGCGMDASASTRACEPFFTSKEDSKDAGLGLSTVYGFVRQCGGSVDIESTVGKGTRVDIYLPFAHGSSGPPRPSTGASTGSGSKA